MMEETILTKAKKYLLKLKKKQNIKNLTELNELKQIIEEIDSITYKIKEWREIESEFRNKQK